MQGDLDQFVCSAGGIPVLVVALDDNSHSVAIAAHQVILDVLDPTMQSGKLVKANEEMLTRMQGLHRYANLLCPIFKDDADKTNRVYAAGDPATLSQDATPFLFPALMWPAYIKLDDGVIFAKTPVIVSGGASLRYVLTHLQTFLLVWKRNLGNNFYLCEYCCQLAHN